MDTYGGEIFAGAITMDIGIDAGPLIGEGGISNYVGPLLRHLLGHQSNAQFHLFLRRSWLKHPQVPSLTSLAPVHPVRIPDRILTWWWDHLKVPVPWDSSGWAKLDLFLGTCLFAPILKRGAVLSIIYDLIPLRLPSLFPDCEAFKEHIQNICGRSHTLIVISQQTKQDLIDLLGVDDRRIHVIYPGRTEHFHPVSPDEVVHIQRHYGLEQGYLLYVGSLGPHKNVVTLLKAYQTARAAGDLKAKLVLVANQRWGQEVRLYADSLPARKDIVWLEQISQEELPALYTGAQAFVFPSRYEGFGLPVLEAMACRTPVVVTRQGALPEVAGDAGCYVDPDNPMELAETLCRLTTDSLFRDRMAEKALVQSTKFSWDRSVSKLLNLMRTVGEGHRSDA